MTFIAAAPFSVTTGGVVSVEAAGVELAVCVEVVEVGGALVPVLLVVPELPDVELVPLPPELPPEMETVPSGLPTMTERVAVTRLPAESTAAYVMMYVVGLAVLIVEEETTC